MADEQEFGGEDRLGQALGALRRGGIGEFARKLRRFARSRLSTYKSQKGQDRWVLETLGGKRNGYFVDLAASDGVTFSNTWVLEKKYGWSGIAIEPNPYFHRRLVRARSCRAEACAIDAEPGSVPFRIDIGGLGGIVADDTKNRPDAGRAQTEGAEIVAVPARTLTQVLDEAEAPARIDYLSLDVEGAEERVLRGLDLERYRFACMTVEEPNDRVRTLLEEAGYRLVREFSLDAFYVDGR